MTEARVLVVEDEPGQRELVAGVLTRNGYRVETAEGLEAALARLRERPADLILSDWKLADGDGMQLLEIVREQHPLTGFIMATAYGSIAQAVEAVHAGADDYLSKPFERQALLLSVQRTLRAGRLAAENRRLNEALEEREALIDIVGKAPAMQRLYRRVEKIAGTEATVLLSGESGTGKELMARAIHQLSRRAHGPFVAVNSAAIGPSVIEPQSNENAKDDDESFGEEPAKFVDGNQSCGHDSNLIYSCSLSAENSRY